VASKSSTISDRVAPQMVMIIEVLAATVAANWSEMELSHSTREEWMVSNLLSTGVIDLKGDDDGEFKITFEVNPPITCLVGGDPPAWNTADVNLITWLLSSPQ